MHVLDDSLALGKKDCKQGKAYGKKKKRKAAVPGVVCPRELF